MEVLIGVDPEGATRDALALGSVLARQFGGDVGLVNVYPTAFDFPGPAHVDAEWRAFVRAESEEFLAECAQYMHSRHGWNEMPTWAVGDHSAGRGLADLAEARRAGVVVIGSATRASEGRFAMGSTADKLMHVSPVPVAAAPWGFARTGVEGLDRLVVAFQDTPEARAATVAVAGFARSAGLPMRLLTVLVKHRMYGSAVRGEAEASVLAQLRRDVAAAQERALATLPADVVADGVVAVGSSVSGALDRVEWTGAELLVLGSAPGGQLRRVFLGDMTYRLLQASPVPTLVFPRRRLT